MSMKAIAAATAALILGLGALDADAMNISLTPSRSAIRVGNAFDVTVAVNGARDGVYSADEIIAFGFDVTINHPALVSWTGATVAIPPFMDDLSGLFANTAVAASVGLGAGITNADFNLAVLHFIATGEGTVELGIVSDLGDPNEGLIYLSEAARDLTASIPLTIQAAEQVPLPGTLMLLVGALPWLTWRFGPAGRV